MMEQRKRRSSTGSRSEPCSCRPKRAAEAPRLSSKFSQADWATASVEAICADTELREAFQAFLVRGRVSAVMLACERDATLCTERCARPLQWPNALGMRAVHLFSLHS